MATSAQAQIGSKVQFKIYNTAASPSAYDAIGYVRSINGFGVEKPKVNSTTLDSDAEEYIPGVADGKEMTIVFVSNSDTLTEIEALIAGTGNKQCVIIWPTPMSVSRFFSLTPQGYEHGTITPS